MNEAERNLNIHHNSICLCCQNKFNRITAGGFKWMYKEEWEVLNKAQ